MKWNKVDKSLKTVVEIDNDTILKVEVYYAPEFEETTNKWGVKWNKQTGKYIVTLHVSKMGRQKYAWSGGIGTFVQVYPEAVERRTIKLLESVAADITRQEILKVGLLQTTEPSLI